jgi:hypothetical protein
MISIMPRQIVVVTALTAIVCIALLVGMFLMLISIVGAPASQTGIMLVAPSYIVPSHQIIDWKTVASPLL